MVTIQTKVLVGVLTAILATLAVYAKLPQKLTVPQSFGALAGPDIPFPYLRWGGVGPIWHYAQAPVATSSVFCAIAVPQGTSTVTYLSWRPDSLGNLGAGQTFDISTTSVTIGAAGTPAPVGSSSPAFIAGASLGTAQAWMPVATSSANLPANIVWQAGLGSGSVNSFVVVSNASTTMYVTWRIATATPLASSAYMNGNCQAEFTQL